MCVFFCFPFFLVSNYTLFSDTVELLRGTHVSSLQIHTFFSPLKIPTRWFLKMPIIPNTLFEIKVSLQNASHVSNCLKL